MRKIKFIFLIAGILFVVPNMVLAAMFPVGAGMCKNRGFEVKTISGDDYCVFPDGNKCLLEEFAEGKCGDEYKTEKNDYCIPVGAPANMTGPDKCCGDAEAYLPPGVKGHPHCTKINFFEKTWNWVVYKIRSLF